MEEKEMNKFRKLAASIAAITTALSLSVGTLAVTANEAKKAIDADSSYTLAKEQFIDNYENTDYLEVAEYLMKNDVSLSTAEDIMKSYIQYKEEQKNKKEPSGTRTLASFYNNSVLSNNQHYGVIISNTGNVYDNSIDFWFIHSSDQLGCSNSINVTPCCSGVNLQGTNINWINHIINIYGAINISSGNSHTGICDFPYNVYTTNTNECDLYYTLNNGFSVSGNDTSATFRYEAYVRGDIDHNGIVNNNDLGKIIEYNLGHGLEYETEYAGMSEDEPMINADVARIVERLAADADRDGVLGLGDVTWISANLDA